MKGNRLYKIEKLCSRSAVNRLFQTGKSAIQYPLRIVLNVSIDSTEPVKFMITVPKKKIRKAVDRVLLRRRIREAYRLNRELLAPLKENNISIEIGFLYLDSNIADYATIEQKMRDSLNRAVKIAMKSIPKSETEECEKLS
ncbi:MAG: ribonuclease P protein component [Bacteroidales bacterium]